MAVRWKEALAERRKLLGNGAFYKKSSADVMQFMADNSLSLECATEAIKKLQTGSDHSINRSSLMKSGLTVTTIKQILTDIDRTFPEREEFQGPSEVKEKLFRVLACYAMYNPAVGYCQGMNTVVGVIVMKLDNEEDAFWVSTSLFEQESHLGMLYARDLKLIRDEYSKVFERLLKDKQEKLANHLFSFNIDANIYLVQWFMSVYTCLPSWDTAMALFDTMVREGRTVLFQAALALMEVMGPELLDMKELAKVVAFIQNPPKELLTESFLSKCAEMTDEQEIRTLLDTVREENAHSLASNETPQRKRLYEEIDGVVTPSPPASGSTGKKRRKKMRRSPGGEESFELTPIPKRKRQWSGSDDETTSDQSESTTKEVASGRNDPDMSKGKQRKRSNEDVS